MGDYKIKFSLQMPYELKGVISFFIFTVILGLAVQFIFTQGTFIWTDFFTNNYTSWMRDIQEIFSLVGFEEKKTVILGFLGQWYYILYTISLLAVVWSVISLIFNFRLDFIKNIRLREIPDLNEIIKKNTTGEKNAVKTEEAS